MKTTLLAALGSMLALAAPSDSNDVAPIDPKATEVLRRMTDFLERQKNIGLSTSGVTEVVTTDGQKLDYSYASNVSIRRPNKLRAERVGDVTDTAFFYDGTTFTVYSKKTGFYAEASAPRTLDAALDAARARLGIEAPAADLFYSNAYAGLMEDVRSGRYLGQEKLGGQEVHHLAFRGEDVDWQVWVDAGHEPIPRRYVITSKKVEGSPDFRVDMSSWDFTSAPADDWFVFTPPPGARKIEFMSRPERTGSGSGAAGKGK